MKPFIKAILDKIHGAELYMTAFPILRCLAEGHEPLKEEDGARVVADTDGSPSTYFCQRCKLVYWE